MLDIEMLKNIQRTFNHQKGQKYPVSNQIVVCGIITNDKNLAYQYIKKLEETAKIISFNAAHYEWIFDNGEKWKWFTTSNADRWRGYRLYKMAIDPVSINYKDFQDVFYPICGSYCCQLDII